MTVKNGIKAVFYDLDGTLHADNPPQLDVFAKHAAELGLTITDSLFVQTARWEYYYFSQSEEILADRINFLDEKSFWSNYIQRQLLALGALHEEARELTPQLYDYMSEHYHPEDIILPGVNDTLNTLKECGYILGLVSNNDKSYDEYLEKTGLNKYFDFSISAKQINSWKPDRRIFEHALQLAGVEAGQTLYVGDNYFTDVVGSLNVGMKPVLLDIQGIFGQPGCPVIRSHSQILDLLERGETDV
jgi:HAD superfamily hydrolase (TIGR01549 family)